MVCGQRIFAAGDFGKRAIRACATFTDRKSPSQPVASFNSDGAAGLISDMLLYQKQPRLALLNPVRVLEDLYRHRELLWQLTWRNIEMQHKGSLFGLSWSILSPLLLFGVYAFVFIAVFDSRFGVVPTETRADYAIGLFLGMALLQLFQEMLTTAPLLVLQNPNYVKKVVFPLEILPVSAFGAALFRCLVALSLALLAVAIWGPGVRLSACWLVVILGLLMLLALGVAWMLSALGVFFRDLGPLMQFAAVLFTFMSGVFYSLSAVPTAFSLLRFNPLLIIVESGRNAVLWGLAPNPALLVFLTLVCAGVCVLGYLVFKLLKPAFADIV
jgi:lipopolysaccharide transport system permease protein